MRHDLIQADRVEEIVVGSNDGYVYALGVGGLARVPESGGELELFTAIDTARTERMHGWPQVLPSGRRMVFTVFHEPVRNSQAKRIAS